MADGGAKGRGGAARGAPVPTLELTPGQMLAEPLTGNLPPEMFTGPGLLALADLLPVMTAYFDRDARVQFINRHFADWLERPRAEIVGKTMADLIGPEAWDARRPMVEGALAGEHQFFVAEFDHPSRGTLVAQSEYVPWRRPAPDGTPDSPDGEVMGFVVVVKDVTEQRVAERALKESEARFRRIANSAPVMMWVTRLDRVREFVNDHYAEFVCGPSCNVDDARTIDWRTRIHPDDVDRIVAESIAGEATLAPFTLEGRYLRHDGEYRWLRSVSQPRFGADGELIGFIGVATDITLAKESELELRRMVDEQTRELALSEARFRAVFDTVLEVLVLMEPDGTIVELNRKEAAWRAENPREAVGCRIWEAPTLKMYSQHVELMKRAVRVAAAGGLFQEEVRMEREGVPTAHLDISVQPVRGPDGAVIYLLFEARDITELKTAQEQLRQSQKMEALGQLTGGIAHDFNNLLTVVVGGLDIIAKRAHQPKLKRYAENALAAAERGARLTAQLLAFSRVQRLEVRPVAIGPIIQNMRPLLRNVLGPGISKKFDLGSLDMPVMADPTQLEVAILNLAINARDAMPDGGVLRFTTSTVDVASDPEVEDGDYVALTISDTGTGMPAEVVERVFEPFFTTKEVGKGTGLGLSMVYGMARQSGGAVRIKSRVGEGTAVTLLFRKAEGITSFDPVAEVPDQLALQAGSPSASVLVIDDDPDVRGFVAAALEEQGFAVRQAADGSEGVAAYQREHADLVIIDFIMPGLSGAEVAREIRGQKDDQAILFVSGYSETDAVKRTAPDAPLLAKPFRADALMKAVRGALVTKA